jgi:hypothetical protein
MIVCDKKQNKFQNAELIQKVLSKFVRALKSSEKVLEETFYKRILVETFFQKTLLVNLCK